RQMVNHGHILVNGNKVDIPSYRIKVGDVISLKDGIQKLARENMESMGGHEVPGWISFNPSELNSTISSLPTSDQIPFDVNTNLIIEFYR
ncbi:MAG: 30S ribosomal protein S4, partial [Phycisphaerales bacterium]|nr:30S ribosomal protein S4 [Phycisphaerales bacterium]